MKRSSSIPLAFSLIIPLLLFTGFASKRPEVTVRFYAEANDRDSDSFSTAVHLENPPRQVVVQKVPAVSERDIEAIYPYRASDGTLGCAFKLDVGGTAKLDSVSVEKRGTSLIAVVNGRQVLDMLIDRRVSDGIITISHGLTEDETKMLMKKYHPFKKEKSPAKTNRPDFND